ncbi:cytochrome B6 [Synechococcus sp. NOUM97013]|uniref:cytochrome B6 n=1 Tax=Synechococcus sp. NOUM97013 TaxID=1442555 RepID=UPI001644FDA6|nr:cytochrome B6 [Synechococcus sp. NOUM97013]QNI75008.1 putative conserved membrane protein [Synechococcus sp. NOUM97013]
MAALQSLITFAFTTAGDAADGLLFGWEIATVQKWVLIYLGVSSLAFVLVWIVGALRTKG